MAAKILVVDDDEFLRELFVMLLESAGYAVESAGDAESALRMLESKADMDLIISDMNMPGMSGLELTKAIRSKGGQVPIIVLSGDRDMPDAEVSGVTEYLLKDENIQDTLLVSVEKVLKK